MSEIAWVTGAGKGLGRHIALQLAQEGWKVAATSRTPADLNGLAAEGESLPGAIVPLVGDITDRAQIDHLVSKIEQEMGPLNLAVLNAGTYIRFGLEDFSAEKFINQIDINVGGTVNSLAPVLAAMRRRRSGTIAIVSSLSAYRGLPMASAYGASKAALTNMCESLKPECDQHGIQLSVIHPGFVRTPLTDKNDFEMPFLMEPEDAARRVLDGIRAGKFEILFPIRFVLILKFLRCLPYSIYFAATRRMVAR